MRQTNSPYSSRSFPSSNDDQDHVNNSDTLQISNIEDDLDVENLLAEDDALDYMDLQPSSKKESIKSSKSEKNDDHRKTEKEERTEKHFPRINRHKTSSPPDDEDDDLVFLEDSRPAKTHADIQVQELDLEDLIEMELNSDESIPKNPNLTPKKEKAPINIHYFALFYLLFCGLLIFFCNRFLNFFNEQLKQYESCQPDSYTDSFMTTLKDEENLQHLLRFPPIEYSEFDDIYQIERDNISYILSASLSYQRAEDYTQASPSYKLYANQNEIGTFSLQSSKQSDLLSFLPTYQYNCDTIEMDIEVIPKEYTIKVPSTYTVLVNGTKLTENYLTSDTEEIAFLSEFAKYTEVPKMVTYHIEGLIYEPTFQISNVNKREVNYLFTGNTVQVPASFESIEFPASMLLDCDTITLAENISLFLGGDLKGKNHGISQITPYIHPDAPVAESLQEELTSRMEEGIPKHTLPEFVFSAEHISDYIRYSDDFFSLKVSLEKNVCLTEQDNENFVSQESYLFYFVKNAETDSSVPWYLVAIDFLENE